jgi:hypothetical protein
MPMSRTHRFTHQSVGRARPARADRASRSTAYSAGLPTRHAAHVTVLLVALMGIAILSLLASTPLLSQFKARGIVSVDR